MKKKDKLSRKRARKTPLDEAIADLFDFAEYEYIDQGMKEWMKSTICGDFSTRMDAQEKDFTLILFEKINAIVNAAYISRP
jgi:predicted transcriptional regulator